MGVLSVALVPDGKYKYKTPQVRTPDTFLLHFVSSAVWLRRKTDLLLQEGKCLKKGNDEERQHCSVHQLYTDKAKNVSDASVQGREVLLMNLIEHPADKSFQVSTVGAPPCAGAVRAGTPQK